MLYVYHGNDIQRRRQAIGEIKEKLQEKRPEAETFSFDHDQFERNQLTELVGSRGLFEDKYIVFLYHVLTIEEGREAITEHAERMSASEHMFVLIEEDLSADNHDTLKKHADHQQELSQQSESTETDPWPLADAYGSRNTKTAWIELQKTMNSSNNSPESIQGLLWWQTKMMWLARECDSADEANVKSYPFKKAKRFTENFTDDELQARTKQLISIYHEAHKGKYDLKNGLEKFILEI